MRKVRKSARDGEEEKSGNNEKIKVIISSNSDVNISTYALFPCPGVNTLPSGNVTGPKGDPEANTDLPLVQV